MVQNNRGRASAVILNVSKESNAKRARIATRLPQSPGPPLAIPAPTSVIPAPPPAIPIPPPLQLLPVVVPPGIQQVPVVAPSPSLSAGGGRVVGGPFAAHTCHRAVTDRWPVATSGPPTSLRVHVITPENHTRDVACGGWLFTDRTTSGTVRVLIHIMVKVELRCQLLLQRELGAVRQVV